MTAHHCDHDTTTSQLYDRTRGRELIILTICDRCNETINTVNTGDTAR